MMKLLKIKHWQLFILLYGIPVMVQVFVMIRMALELNFFMMKGFVAAIAYSFIIFFCWNYSMGTNLNKKLPDTVKMNLTRFKVFLFIPYSYLSLFCLFICGMMTGIFKNIPGGPPPEIIIPIVAIVIPLHLFSMFCLFYCLYFISKSLKAVELQKPVTFSDYAGEFFLIWFFPIGIWILQPRINKIFDESLSTTCHR